MGKPNRKYAHTLFTARLLFVCERSCHTRVHIGLWPYFKRKRLCRLYLYRVPFAGTINKFGMTAASELYSVLLKGPWIGLAWQQQLMVLAHDVLLTVSWRATKIVFMRCYLSTQNSHASICVWAKLYLQYYIPRSHDLPCPWHHWREEMYQALSCLTILQATGSWAKAWGTRLP